MGMFDELRCDHELPTYPQLKGYMFQTKDFECLGDMYVITEGGRLVFPAYEVVEVEGAHWGMGGKVKVRRQVGEYQDQFFHGTVNFYGAIFAAQYMGVGKPARKVLEELGFRPDPGKDHKWVEYEATFVRGQLTGIKLLNG